MSVTQMYPALPALVRAANCPLKQDKTGEKLIYGSNNTVVVRDIEPSADGKINVMTYTKHSKPVTCAAMSTSGAYIASGDESGTVHIWACDTPDQIIKLETIVFAGPVLDIAWSADNQRILCVGGSGQVFGKVFMWDSGNSVGEISGHAKKVNSCSFKSSRPFRLITGGEDGVVNFYEGPPFKYKSKPKTHTNYVNCCRFSPDGSRFFSASSDMFVAVFDGKDASPIIEKKVHAGSIYDACWSPDGTQILTCSGDGTCLILDGGTLEKVAEISFKSGDRKKSVSEQQKGCIWTKNGILSYSLGGILTLYRAPTDAAPALLQYGHYRGIGCLAYDGASGTLYSGSYQDGTGTLVGLLLGWKLASGLATPFAGEPHANKVMGVGVCGSTVVTCGSDDSVIFSEAPTWGEKVPIGACPISFSCATSVACVVTTTDMLVAFSVTKKAKIGEVKLPFSPTCVAVAPTDGVVAVGGEDSAVHLLSIEGKETFKLERHKAKISCLAYAPSGAQLASGCTNKEIVVWDPNSGTPLVTGLQGFHTATISSLAFGPGDVLASGGVDAMIIVWNLTEKAAKHKLPLAHTSGGVGALTWISATELASAGNDGAIKRWAV